MTVPDTASRLRPDDTVACVGDTCIDVSLLTGEAALGGNAVNVAVRLHRQGLASELIARLGDDEDGRRIVAALAGYGIRADRSTFTSERTCRAYLATDHLGHTWVSDVEGVGSPTSIPPHWFELLTGFRHVFAKGLASPARLIRHLRDNDVVTSYDYSFIDDDLGESAADIVFYSAGEGNLRRGRDFARAALDRGATIAIATLGADGCLALTADGREVRTRLEPVDAIDTIGAGDAFIAGFLGALIRGHKLEAALSAGAREGAGACLHALAFEQQTWPAHLGARSTGVVRRRRRREEII